MSRITNKAKQLAYVPDVVATSAMEEAGLNADDLYSDLIAYNKNATRAACIMDSRLKNAFYVVCMKRHSDIDWIDVHIVVLENADGIDVISEASSWLA